MKYEEVYPKSYVSGEEAEQSLREYFDFYCHRRLNQSLGYKTLAEGVSRAARKGRPFSPVSTL